MTELKFIVSSGRAIGLAAGAAGLAAVLLMASFDRAAARPPGHGPRGGDHDWRGGDYRGNRGRGGWGGGYYRAPPVVYGSPYYTPYATPYYSPPPVVYGPGIGVITPGVRVRIR